MFSFYMQALLLPVTFLALPLAAKLREILLGLAKRRDLLRSCKDWCEAFMLGCLVAWVSCLPGGCVVIILSG